MADVVTARPAPGLRTAGQERAGHRRQLGHRPGDRRALRRVRRERRDQLPAPARGGRATPRSRSTPAPRRSQQEGVRDVLVGGDVSDEDDVVRMVGEAVERPRRPRHPRQQRRHPDLAADRGALERRLRQGARRQPARLVPVRPRGDPPLPRRGEAAARSSTSRASTSSSRSPATSATRRARAGCRTSPARSRSSTPAAASASTASARARRSPRSTARGSTTRSSARRSRSTSRCGAPATPTRWRA